MKGIRVKHIISNILLITLWQVGVSQVGIGTTTPSGMLHIVPTAANALVIDPYGTNTGETGEVQFKELTANGSNHVGLKAPDNIAADVVFVLPPADGTSGQALVTDGSGNLSWTSSSNGWWEELGSTTLTSAGTEVAVIFTPKKYLMVIASIVGDGGTDANQRVHVGNGSFDTGTNYSFRRSINGGSDVTEAPRDHIAHHNQKHFSEHTLFIVNDASYEKLFINHSLTTSSGTGAGNAPNRAEVVAKWANTSNQIDRIRFIRTTGMNYQSGTTLSVYGHD